MASSKVVKGYAALAKALAQGDQEDRRLATGIVETVRGIAATGNSDRTSHAIKPHQSDRKAVDPQPSDRTPTDKKPSHER